MGNLLESVKSEQELSISTFVTSYIQFLNKAFLFFRQQTVKKHEESNFSGKAK